MTLRTLSHQLIFGAVLRSFQGHLKAAQRDILVAELRRMKRHVPLEQRTIIWNSVAMLEASGKIQWHVVPPRSNDDSQDDDSPPSVYLHSAQLAAHLKKPLFADDRVLQTLVYQSAPSYAYQAFDSACFSERIFRLRRLYPSSSR